SFADDEYLGVGSGGCVDVLAESLHRVAAPEKKGSRRNSVRGLSASNETQLLCSHWFFVCLTGEFSGAFLLILQDSREQDTTATIRRNSTLKDARRTKSHITRAKESRLGRKMYANSGFYCAKLPGRAWYIVLSHKSAPSYVLWPRDCSRG